MKNILKKVQEIFGICRITMYIYSMVEFTEKEIQTVKMLSQDYTVRSAALKLGLKKRGLENMVVRIKLKTGLKTIGGIVSYFFRNHLIE